MIVNLVFLTRRGTVELVKGFLLSCGRWGIIYSKSFKKYVIAIYHQFGAQILVSPCCSDLQFDFWLNIKAVNQICRLFHFLHPDAFLFCAFQCNLQFIICKEEKANDFFFFNPEQNEMRF